MPKKERWFPWGPHMDGLRDDIDAEEDARKRWSNRSPAEVYALQYAASVADSPVFDLKAFHQFEEAKKVFQKKVNELLEPFLRHPVDLHLAILKGIIKTAEGSSGDDRRHLGDALSTLRNADLFELPSQLFDATSDYAQTVNDHLLEKYKDAPRDQDWDDFPEVAELLHMPIPSHLPFDNFFMISWPQETIHLRSGSKKPTECMSLGWHVTKDKVYKIGVGVVLGDDGLPCGLSAETEPVWTKEDGWGDSGYPISTTLLIEWINDHRQYIEDRRPYQYRKKMKAAGKVVKSPPPPYYVVLMRDDLIIETMREVKRKVISREIDWQYRWTVRGHEMVRVRRGPLPLSDEDRRKLRDRNYTVYTDCTPSENSDDYKRLRERGLEGKAAEEWLAILVIWRESHTKGPEDKPFIPAMRKSARKREHTIRIRFSNGRFTRRPAHK